MKKVISIEFFGMQRTVTKTDSIYMPISENMKITDVLEYVRIHYPSLPLDKGMVLVTVNQEMASLDTMLKANDTVLFLPFISGG
jgi:molybdopterin converting factor small subunit